MHIELTLDTGGHGRPYDTALAFEAFGATVDQRLQGVRVLHVDHGYESAVDPAAGFNGV